jgi:signal transduction histidine kinase
MTLNPLPVRRNMLSYIDRFARFVNPIIDTLARWSWWRVLAFSLLLAIAGSAMDEYFFAREPVVKKRVVKATKATEADVKITIKDGKVVVQKGNSLPVPPVPPVQPNAPGDSGPLVDSGISKSIEQLTRELESNERNLEQALEKLEELIERAASPESSPKTETGTNVALADTLKKLAKSIKDIQANKETTINVIEADEEDHTRPDPTQIFGPFAFLSIIAMIALKLIGGARVREQAATVRADQATASADASDLQRQVAEARLLRMQAQVEPHFLFNTLAALERLIEVNPTKALAMSQALSQWLRALLPQMKEGHSTLGQEVTLVQSYLQLMQMRMGDRLAYFVDVPENLRAQAIPSMLLQPLVENSIKHGLEPKKIGGEVRVKARKQGNMLELTVEDTGIGFAANPNTGNGLSNLRERLDLLFGGKAMLSIVPRTNFGSGGVDDQALTGSIITIKLPV